MFSMERRQFFKEWVSILLGALSVFIPLGAGLIFFLDPLRRTSRGRDFLRIAAVDSLPLGVPRMVKINTIRKDAWSTSPNEPIGAVYLIRKKKGIEAFQALCPHAGCFVDYTPGKHKFECPCHGSSFELDGSRTSSSSPSPRGMDHLETRVEGNDVLVRYEEFQQGIGEKIVIS